MDLIPEDYRRYLQQLLILQRWGFTMAAFMVLVVLLSLTWSYRADGFQKEIVSLEKQKAISSQQRELLQSLEKNRNKLVAKHDVLEKLRGGALAENMFVTLDRALENNNVWFKSWRFDRAGSRTSEPAKGVHTGYFIVIPENERKNKKANEAWKIQTHMEVDGEAKDHEALSSFVRRLLQQPQIGDVKILNTRQQSYANKTVVSFKLAITVNSRYSNT